LICGSENQRDKDHSYLEEAGLYWRSLWEEVHQNERAEWIRRQGKGKISNINWMLIRTTETMSLFSEAYN
jgi:hypothetical protein